ncbi:hypothetical protein AAFO92_07975 [Roseovarius sp. CAU 1744]|uniref:hypothetical protein n=1 Tax=Roseovarius sp. CAU 1744 TaxID=3140368 RepID=UPI00325AD2C9
MSDALQEFLETRRLVLHLGAHKTATTYIQSVLAAERAALRAKGVGLILPGDLRRDTAPQDRQGKISDATRQLTAFAADPAINQIVLSEENLIGSTGNNLRRNSLYPGLKRKLSRLPAPLDHPNNRILFALRDYGPYLSSSVTTAIRRGKVFDPEALRAGFLPFARSWADVVADLREAFPAAEIKIWRYEDFADCGPMVFSAIADGFDPAPQAHAFRTLSGEAMRQILPQLHDGSSRDRARRIVRQAARRHPISDANPAFTLWSPEEARQLSDAYERHWHEIRESHPGIELAGG